ncbi:MAG TPA: phytanoyl-CoA dioxygenase family protein [Candidatus Polarisedimenticolia bacterium]|nr:phytanoyl-CoA dioxygenase family protein [Candidatus Polarisedimenticolia bacterium]
MPHVVNVEIPEALRQCGVAESTLAPWEKDALDQNGYVLLAQVIDTHRLEQLRAAFESVMSREPPEENDRSRGTRHAADLPKKDAAFDEVHTHPRLLAAVHHVLRRPFRVFQVAGRDPAPGYGQQGLHADWLPRAPSAPFSIVTAIWLLDDFTSTNGATRLVPGSHHLVRPIPKGMADPESRHPDQTVIAAKAGAVLVFNGHLWHSGTRNLTDRPRRAVQCQFLARDHMRPSATSPVVIERLGPAARQLLGD